MDSILEQIEYHQTSKTKSTEYYHSKALSSAKFEDFELLNLIGKGSFGKVFLVKQKMPGQVQGSLFARKCIRKDVILQNGNVESLLAERNILTSIKHPFLVDLSYVFHKAHRVYFIMEFI